MAGVSHKHGGASVTLTAVSLTTTSGDMATKGLSWVTTGPSLKELFLHPNNPSLISAEQRSVATVDASENEWSQFTVVRWE